MGLLSGRRPANLGYSEGKFKPCSWKPNCVSSTAPADDARHHIAPLGFTGDAQAAWQRLTAIVKAAPRVNIVREGSDYLYAEFASKGLGFVDDVEFALDAGGKHIHVRSASRLGVRDFGVNRARVEGIRSRFAAR
ncbi:MAG: DUF1499 domain-containing protein [Burkholderiales bacterium]|nr:DUF1499 domain-containing protein [Burkholderiales bacterium]